jgi:hypothetical protein
LKTRGRGKTPDDEITAEAQQQHGQLMFARPVLIFPHFYANNSVEKDF